MEKARAALPTKADAEKLLHWAHEQNPGPWMAHSKAVARAAQTIAEHSGLEGDRAYVLGLLHDIGRYEGVRSLHHVCAGADLMLQYGYEEAARICITHSFPYQDIHAFAAGDFDCSPTEIEDIISFLGTAVYTDYDHLIQLCDSLGTAQGICIMEKRFVDVVRRHGFNDLTQKKWDAWFEIKHKFDRMCGENIYNLFYDEIKADIFK